MAALDPKDLFGDWKLPLLRRVSYSTDEIELSTMQVAIEIKPWMRWLARSPLAIIICPLAGIAGSFCPWMLFEFGSYQAVWYEPIVLVCFVAVYLMTWVGIIFGTRVIWAVRRAETAK